MVIFEDPIKLDTCPQILKEINISQCWILEFLEQIKNCPNCDINTEFVCKKCWGDINGINSFADELNRYVERYLFLEGSIDTLLEIGDPFVTAIHTKYPFWKKVSDFGIFGEA